MFANRFCAVLGAIALGLSGLGGCREATKFEFDALDIASVHEELSELSLGHYRIPIPVTDLHQTGKRLHRNRMQLDFELVALVPPSEQSHFAHEWSRHEGKIRHHVLCVCRNASSEELLEPDMTTLKAKLIDALASHMDEREVRQLLLNDVVSQPL